MITLDAILGTLRTRLHILPLATGRLQVIRVSKSGNTVSFAQVRVQRGDDFVLAPGAYFVLPVGHYKPDEDMLSTSCTRSTGTSV